jgi:DNA-binding MarR family transcriptional regulator
MTDVESLFSDLIRLETELWEAIEARLLAEFGLPLSQFEPMQVMGRLESCRVLDIATELSITVGGVSKLVDRIEAAGYCTRRPNPADRRSSIIELTPPGQRMLQEASLVFRDELERRVQSVLRPGELAELAATIRLLRSARRPE